MKKRKRISVFLAAALALCLACGHGSDARAAEDGAKVMVSMGDSYSSGEGIEPFFGQEKPVGEKISDQGWLAHRSKNAWSGMLRLPGNSGPMSASGDNWRFVAASGAETKHIQGAFKKDYNIGGYKDYYSLPAQIEAFNEVQGTVDYVTLTLGGNDADFVGILKETFLADVNFINPNALLDKMDGVWAEFNKDDGIRAHMKQAYKDIAAAAGKDAAIIVAGYPKLLNKNGALTISATNAQYVDYNVSRFNRKINSLVEECQGEGLNIHFVSVEEIFDGHEAYTDFPYINGAILLAQSEDLDSTFPISAYSIHPNLAGARAYADAVQKKIDELEAKKAGNEDGSENGGDSGSAGDTGNAGGGGSSSASQDFSIVGTWKSVGAYGFGQAQPGATVTFDGTHCNFYSPDDTYEFYQLNGRWLLQTKNVLWGDVLSFDVEVLDNDHINVIYNAGSVTELERIGSSGNGAAPAPPDDGEDPGGSGAVPEGTYISNAYGFIQNTFTFYGGNRVTMDTLGIVGDGTYEIRNGEIIISYTTNISDSVCVWSASFAMSGDRLYIGGDEFVKQ